MNRKPKLILTGRGLDDEKQKDSFQKYFDEQNEKYKHLDPDDPYYYEKRYYDILPWQKKVKYHFNRFDDWLRKDKKLSTLGYSVAETLHNKGFHRAGKFADRTSGYLEHKGYNNIDTMTKGRGMIPTI